MVSENYVYIGNLPFDATEQMIRDALAPFVTVRNVTLAIDKETGRFMGFAYAELSSVAEVTKVIGELNGKNIGGRASYLGLSSENPDLWERVFI